jgi:hypothetical protein
MSIGFWWENQKLREAWLHVVDNIKVDHRVMKWDGTYLVALAQDGDDRTVLVNVVMIIWVL